MIYRSGRDYPTGGTLSIEQLNAVERYFEISDKHYGDPALDSILQQYLTDLKRLASSFRSDQCE